jgi:hypothetical protein
MLQPVSKHPKGERLRFRHGLFPRDSVREHARQLGHFPDPPTVFFALNINSELAHGSRDGKPVSKSLPPRLRASA